jgi:hypothetical protein
VRLGARIGILLCKLGLFAAFCLAMTAAALFLHPCGVWLLDGVWNSLSIQWFWDELGWGYPRLKAVGLQRIIDGVLAVILWLPLWLVSLVSAGVIAGISISRMDKIEAAEHEYLKGLKS